MTKNDNPQTLQQPSKRNGDTIAGPLVVSETNPRYFTVASGSAADRKAIYLTGSHIWHNFHDGMGPGADCADVSEELDFDAYLKFLKEHGHNFIRLWRWEQFKSQAASGGFHLCMTPQPWLRTGPGDAKDGKPKFNLEVFNQTYFDRLRDRIIAAGHEGIYVAVMFFDGWALHLSPAPDNVEGHPFHAANNVNGVGIESILDYQVLPLDPRVQAFQEEYIRRVVDTLHDLPNVLWEVANESSGGGTVDKNFAQMMGFSEVPEWGDSTEWQYWVIEVVKRHEQAKRYDTHPIGMTMQFPVADQTMVNEPLFKSKAEWISPGYDDEIFTDGRHPMAPDSPPSHWFADPPASDGRKVSITDTDHYAPGKGDALWAWKSFLRGHHPILMDFGIIAGVNPPDPSAVNPGVPPYEAFEAARYAMGDTLHYAQKMNLIAMEPRGDLTSTGFALAKPGEEYLILQPGETTAPFTVMVEAGSYAVEWFSLNGRETKSADRVTVRSNGNISFTTPLAEPGPVVLYLKQTAHRM
ncbi:MAG: hypothetical protein EHM33_09025 [Chloroflexi bacterium]|nr:MAG: hypothetical protein EHM33_09025 [Chloroflexota bacterium]